MDVPALAGRARCGAGRSTGHYPSLAPRGLQSLLALEIAKELDRGLRDLIRPARVSSPDQTLVSQDAELHKAGAVKVYREKISGVAARRPQLEKLLHIIGPGDVVLVTRLDRLARSTRDLLNILDKIGKAGAQFKSLRETWADTTTPVGKLMITIIGGIAEFERELIRARTGDGIRRAKAAGVHMGRPPKLTKHQQREVLARLACGEETLVEIARTYNVSHMTISRLKTQHAAS